MECFKHRLIKPSKTRANGCERKRLVRYSERHVRKIHRIPTKIRETTEDDRQIRSDPGETSQQTTTESSNNVISEPRESFDHKNQKGRKLEDEHPRFGPFYTVDHSFLESTKDRAWKHVLQKTPSIDSSEINSSETDSSEKTKEIYLKAIREVEEEAKRIYAGEVLSGVESEFRWMMIKDGCFFLQLAFMILGCSEQLEYSQDGLFLDEKPSKKKVKKWIEAMFFVGNQIPLLVLKVLMKQEFFQGVVRNGNWNPPPLGFCENVLFELLVLPEIGRGSSSNVSDQDPCELIHFLHNKFIGPDPPIHLSGTEQEDETETDLEANEDDTDDDEMSFPCATKLREDGIDIKVIHKGGVRSIDFKISWCFCATLYLPAFPVDENAETVVTSLKTYEMSQEMGKDKRQVSAYLRFMSNVIQTTEDVKLLEKAGIIQGNLIYADKLPGILKRLMSSKDIRLTDKFHILRRKIRNYSSPWIYYKGLLNLVLIITFFQFCMSLVDYIWPRKP